MSAKRSEAILVTGGAGFIGANFVLEWVRATGRPVINLDKLTYAGNLQSLGELKDSPLHHFVHGDITDTPLVEDTLRQYRPVAVVHFAAESHVDRSIHGPGDFVQTNIVGTFHLLEAIQAYWRHLPSNERDFFRFVHVSTDEVYGSLSSDEPAFREDHRYQPSSPYSASKAGADHLVRAYRHTYGLPAIVTNCSNNYGPYQFPEKLIPLVILNATHGKPLPVYGDGLNVRDWLYVKDHCSALRIVLQRGRVGETYNIGGGCERNNLEVVRSVCAILDECRSLLGGGRHADLITFVPDRPGHDRRYAMNTDKISGELEWRPEVAFEEGLRRTVAWYLDNGKWVNGVASGAYRDWIALNYAQRGLA